MLTVIGVFGAQILPFHVVPLTQLAEALLVARSDELLYNVNTRLLYGTVTATFVPEFPDDTVVFGADAPVFEVLLVSTDVPTGFVVVHERFTVHELAPEAIVQLGEAGVSVPVGIGVLDTGTVIDAVAFGTPAFVHVMLYVYVPVLG